MIELLIFISDVSFELVPRRVHSSFFLLFATVPADIVVRFSVFLDLSGFSFFIKFQTSPLDRVKTMFSIVSLHFLSVFSKGC